ncbi:hypothetical protein A4X13_0g8382, partial [Tilletia indica]
MSSSPQAFDPAADWSLDQIAGIPTQVLMADPAFQALIQANTPQHSTNPPPPPPPFSAMAGIDPRLSSAPTSNPAIAASSPASASTSAPPNTANFSQAQRKTLLWTEDDAKEVKKRYGAKQIVLNAEGIYVGRAALRVMWATIKQACAVIEDLNLRNNKGRQVRKTFRNLKAYSLTTLLRICSEIEAEHPELAWCQLHYKALKLVQLHLRSKNDNADSDEEDAS